MLGRLGISRDTAVGWALVLPAAAVLVAFLAYPLFYVVYNSFFTLDLAARANTFVGWRNYTALVADPEFAHSVSITAAFVTADLAIQFVLGLALALFAKAYLDDRARGGFVAVMLIPAILAPVVVGLFFKVIYNTDYGVLNWGLQYLGVPPIPWTSDAHWALWSIILASSWTGGPMMFIILLGGLLNLPDSVYEAAQIDGAGAVRQFFHMTLPMLSPIIFIALILRFADVFNLFDKIFVLTSGGPGQATETIPMHLYRLAFLDLDLSRADALAVVMLVVQMAVGFVMVGAIRRGQMAPT